MAKRKLAQQTTTGNAMLPSWTHSELPCKWTTVQIIPASHVWARWKKPSAEFPVVCWALQARRLTPKEQRVHLEDFEEQPPAFITKVIGLVMREGDAHLDPPTDDDFKGEFVNYVHNFPE